MEARILKQSVARNVMILVVRADDRDTGATGQAGSMVISASKNGGAFATITPTITERGDGHYMLALTTSHTDTVGDLVLKIATADGAPLSELFDVQAPATDTEFSSAFYEAVANAVHQESFETAIDEDNNIVDLIRGMHDALVGRVTGFGTNTITIKSRDGGTTRYVITLDSGGRASVTTVNLGGSGG